MLAAKTPASCAQHSKLSVFANIASNGMQGFNEHRPAANAASPWPGPRRVPGQKLVSVCCPELRQGASQRAALVSFAPQLHTQDTAPFNYLLSTTILHLLLSPKHFVLITLPFLLLSEPLCGFRTLRGFGVWALRSPVMTICLAVGAFPTAFRGLIV